MNAPSPSLAQGRSAVYAAFALSGVLFASLVSRLPDVRSGLGLSNGELGLLLLSTSAGSVLSLPFAGRLIERFGARDVVRAGGIGVCTGLLLAALGATTLGWLPLTVVGLFASGVGVSVWDVAMNVEGAEVERQLRRTIMPRFHASWSVGSIVGSALGIPMAAFGVPVVVHLLGVCVPAYFVTLVATRYFLPEGTHVTKVPEGAAPISPWREKRTLLIGVMVLAYAMVEGAANDWLSLGFIDGYHVEHWVGVSAFSLFVVSMTVGRLVGPLLLDRFGRAPMLWGCSAAAFTGILVTVYAGSPGLAMVGVVIWGLGAALGFPVGMSAAADDPVGSAKRVSAVSTIGYGAFLIGPPCLGWIGDRIGTLDSLLVVAALMIPAALSVFAVRRASVPAVAEG
jgi:MFS family permease